MRIEENRLEELIKAFPDINPEFIKYCLEKGLWVYPDEEHVEIDYEYTTADLASLCLEYHKKGYTSFELENDRITFYKDCGLVEIKNALKHKLDCIPNDIDALIINKNWYTKSAEENAITIAQLEKFRKK